MVMVSSLIGCELSNVMESVGVDPNKSAMMILRLKDEAIWTWNECRIDASYSPASTTKIPHTLIALEEGYVDGPETLFKWDGQSRNMEVWNQDLTFRSAYKYSAKWVYERITHNLGYEVMSKWMNTLEFGNRYIGKPEDLVTYWVEGPLSISVRQQVLFLSRLVRETLPLSANTYRVGKEMMYEDSGDGWVLYAKSGFSGTIGWYVGWVESTVSGLLQTYVFAFNMDISSWDELPKRKDAVKAALCLLEVIKP